MTLVREMFKEALKMTDTFEKFSNATAEIEIQQGNCGSGYKRNNMDVFNLAAAFMRRGINPREINLGTGFDDIEK